jgi:diguanylate cyclase (GGDEF)-like protein/PAS domain S-box-containing protein
VDRPGVALSAVNDDAKSREELIAELRGLRALVHGMNSIVLRWDPQGRVLFLNEYGQQLFGYRADEILGRSVVGLIVPETESSGRDLALMIDDLLEHPERYLANENENMRRDGTRVWITWRNRPVVDAAGRLVEIVSTGIDATDRKRADDALRASEERFRRLSTHDDLTGLFNTRYLHEALAGMVETSAVAGTRFALVFMDLDEFKRVVDRVGHLDGSRVIQEVAVSIRTCLEPNAFGVAYAGDEFVIVLPGFDKEGGIAKADQIRRCVRETVYGTTSGHAIRMTASFGVAAYPDDADDVRTLMGLADQALFSIKRRGKDSVAAA